ncbi:hypothetical protein Zmor_009480 [Zophobas morio]|uniref:Uncharacterized protein n=1 Tax=Zophobas morio TaxID=2755281 RepID=A0AA38IM06_9CUCU|nr:hypothetical protein Zmor_009480 [Zophobas morio]
MVPEDKMSRSSCCIQCSVGSMIFLQILVGFILLLTTFSRHSQTDSYHKNLRLMTYCLLVSGIILVVSSVLLLSGVIWRQPKCFLAHLATDVVIIILVIIFIGIATYNNGGDPEVVLSMGFALAIPVAVMCALDYGVYCFYKRVVADKRQQQQNMYELCSTDINS